MIIIPMMNHHVLLCWIQRGFSHSKDLKRNWCKATLQAGWSWNYCTSVYKQPSWRKCHFWVHATNSWENADERGEEETVMLARTSEPLKFKVQNTISAVVCIWFHQSWTYNLKEDNCNTGGSFPAKTRQFYSPITSCPAYPLLSGGSSSMLPSRRARKRSPLTKHTF